MMRLTSILLVSLLTTSLASGQVQVRTYLGTTTGERFGWSVAVVGDVDGDGADDLAVGAPGPQDASLPGRVTIFSGRTSQSIREWSGGAAGDFFGYALAPVGDLDGDGLADVLVGAPQKLLPSFFFYEGTGGPTGPGYAQVLSGATGAVIHTVSGSTLADGVGASVAAGGDVDGDGVTELLIGGTGSYQHPGTVRVVSGATGATLRTHMGSYNFDGFGHSVAFLGDLGRDGIDDYAIGDAGQNGGDGAVRVYKGATGDEFWTVDGPPGMDSETGFSIARLGDVDGDGRSDLLVGGRADNVYPQNGRVMVLSGATGATLFEDHATSGHFLPDGYGFSVTGIGDLDGDGREDFAASQPGPDPDFRSSYYPVRVFAGQPLSLAFEIPPPSTNGMWGIGLCSGDATGDGLRDIVVGQPYADRVIIYSAVRSVTTFCETEVNSQGCSPHIQGVGTPSASSNQPFVISANNILNNKFGLLLYGRAPRQVPLGGGWSCVKQLLKRTAVRSSGGNAPPDDCSGAYQDDFNQRIQSGVDPALVPGVQVFAQYWYRDPQSPGGRCLTDGLAFYVNP